MFLLEDVLTFHDRAVERYGGAKGLRDFGALDSALSRPWQTFGGEDLYPTCFKKAAAIAESIILNHPFVDGNKRTAFILCEAILESDGYSISAKTQVIYDFLVSISTGSLPFEDIVGWLQQNTSVKEN